jgi:hypothetical protein
VGNEAVDQLVKFNQALADHSATDSKPHLIDGIVLTKFDTIDDQVCSCYYKSKLLDLTWFGLDLGVLVVNISALAVTWNPNQ